MYVLNLRPGIQRSNVELAFSPIGAGIQKELPTATREILSRGAVSSRNYR